VRVGMLRSAELYTELIRAIGANENKDPHHKYWNQVRKPFSHLEVQNHSH